MKSKKQKMLEDIKGYFERGVKLHIGDKVYVSWEDIMWVLDAALDEPEDL